MKVSDLFRADVAPAVLGDHSSVGASSTVKPGTVVGFRTSIEAGVVAEGIYRANRIVKLAQTTEIKSKEDRAI